MSNTELDISQTLKLLESVHKVSNIGIFHYQVNSENIYWNEVLRSIYEVSKHYKPTIGDVNNFIEVENLHKEKSFLNTQAIDLVESFEIEREIKTAKGNKRYAWVIGETKYENGKCVYVYGTVIDITERKKSKIESQKKDQQLLLVEQMVEMGYWRWDTITDEVNWSDNLYKIFDKKKGTKLTIETYYEHVHPEDVDFVKNIFEKAFLTKKLPTYSHRIVLKNGTIKTIKATGNIITNKKGDIIEMLGTSQNITEQQAKEYELLKNNQQLLLAEEISLIGYWQWNTLTQEVIWSDKLCDIYGHDKSEPVTFEKYQDYIHEADRNGVLKDIETALSTKKFHGTVYRIKLKDGTIKTLKTMGKVITDNNGNITEIIGTCQDITEVVKKEQELLQKNQQFKKAERITMTGSWLWKANKYEWSDNLYKLYDFEVGTPLDFETFLTHIHPEDHARLKNLRSELVRTKLFEKTVHRTVHKNGEIRTIETFGKVVTNENGEIVEVLGTTRDITEQKKSENKILEANKNLEKTTLELTARNKQLAEFNHITSHNLRAPVSNLNALLDIWKDAENEKLKEELFGKFEIVIDHLTLTLNSLIESLKVTNNNQKTTKKLHFNTILNKTKEILAAEILNTGAIIRSDFSTKNSISYNEIYLESIFLNLISNALKYKSPNRIPEIFIKSNVDKGKTTLFIKDNGLGIDLKRHGHKLFGLHKVFHRHPEANGIGLFLTKAQIESMGGTIFADSEVNVGTTFFITFN